MVLQLRDVIEIKTSDAEINKTIIIIKKNIVHTLDRYKKKKMLPLSSTFIIVNRIWRGRLTILYMLEWRSIFNYSKFTVSIQGDRNTNILRYRIWIRTLHINIYVILKFVL